MTRTLLTIALFFAATITSYAQIVPEDLSSSCEPSRMRTLPYPSAEMAQTYGSTAAASLYIRPISNWEMTDEEDAVVFRSKYIYPFTWLNRQALLYIESASGAYEVVINDKPAGSSFNGFAPTEFNITKISNEEENTIAIRILKEHWSQRLHNESFPTPQLGEVYVLSQPTIRVRDIVHNTSIDVTGENANVEVGIVVKTESLNPKKARIHYQLVAADSTITTYGHRDITLQMRGEDTIKFMARIPSSELWSAERPTRYRVNITTQIEGRKVEYQSHWVGFRNVEQRDDKLLINGKPASLSFAVCDPTKDFTSEITAARQRGKNAIHFTALTVPQKAYHLCDSLGMYVVANVPINTSESGSSRRIGGNESNNPAWHDAFIATTDAAWRTTCGFAGVVAYSIADDSANGINLYESYLHLKGLEPQRPIIYQYVAGEWNSDKNF